MKTFSTSEVEITKKVIERRVLYEYRQERDNVEFKIMNVD